MNVAGVNMEHIKELEHKIENEWSLCPNKEITPYEYLLDTLGVVTIDTFKCGDYFRELVRNNHVTDYSEAIAHGFDDLSGFTFFYLAKYYKEKTDILERLYIMKRQGDYLVTISI
jgi:hypothetical protein